MIALFASMVNAAAAALIEASATLAEKLEAAGEGDHWVSVSGGRTSSRVANRNPRELLRQVRAVPQFIGAFAERPAVAAGVVGSLAISLSL